MKLDTLSITKFMSDGKIVECQRTLTFFDFQCMQKVKMMIEELVTSNLETFYTIAIMSKEV